MPVSVACTVWQTLTVSSNDPDSGVVTVALHGDGVPAPDIGVSPDSFYVALGLNEIANRTLTLSNTGGSPLYWTAGVSLSFGDSAMVPPPQIAKGERPSGDDRPRPEGASGHARDLLGRLSTMPAAHVVLYDDMENGLNGWTTQSYGQDSLWHQSERAYTSPTHSWWCGDEATGTYQTGRTIQNAAISPPIDLRAVQAPASLEFFEVYETETNFDECKVEVSTDGGTYWQTLRGFAWGSSQGWRLTSLDLSAFIGHVVRIRFYFDTHDPVANNYPGWFFDDVLVTTASPPWISVSPESGTVPASGSTALQVSFNSTGMLGGLYSADVILASNDPDEGQLAVPVRLRVIGIPDIAVAPAALDFGSLFAGLSRTDTSLVVQNNGSDRLIVSQVEVTSSAFFANPAPFTLAPGGTYSLPVTFAPASPGDVTASLVLHSNDPDHPLLPVALHGVALVPPDIQVSPDSLSVLLQPNQTETRTLTLSNVGGSALIWSTSVDLSGANVLYSGESGAGGEGSAVADGIPGKGPRVGALSRGRDPGRGGAPHKGSGAGLIRPSGGSGVAGLMRRRIEHLAPGSLMFYDDMEGATTQWTTVNLSQDDLWHRTTRAYSSPIRSWWCGLESSGTYATGRVIRNGAVSPPIDLRTAQRPVTLEFMEYFQTEFGWDYCSVEVSMTTAGAGAPSVPASRGAAEGGC